jgi:hypothetical protein
VIADDLEHRIADTVDALRAIADRHAPAVFASSFGAEDMVVIDLIAKHRLPIRVFTLDTGRLPDETHALIDRTRKRYGLPVDVYAPDTRRVRASFARMASMLLRQRRIVQELLSDRKGGAALPRTGGQRLIDQLPAGRAIDDPKRPAARGVRRGA